MALPVIREGFRAYGIKVKGRQAEGMKNSEVVLLGDGIYELKLWKSARTENLNV